MVKNVQLSPSLFQLVNLQNLGCEIHNLYKV